MIFIFIMGDPYTGTPLHVCKTVVILNGCTKVSLFMYIRVYRGGTSM